VEGRKVVRWGYGLLICCVLTGVSGPRSALHGQAEPGPWPRLLVVRVATVMTDPEAPVPDGYSVWVNGDTARAVAANGELRWALPAFDALEVELRDIGACEESEGNPRRLVGDVDRVADTVDFRLTCGGAAPRPPPPPEVGSTDSAGTSTEPATGTSDPRPPEPVPIAILHPRGRLTVARGSAVTFSSAGSSGGEPLLSPPGSPLVNDTSIHVHSPTTYVLTVTGAGGSQADSVMIDVFDPPDRRPRARLTATPSSVWHEGEAVTLLLEAEYADFAVLREVSLRGGEVVERVVQVFQYEEDSPPPETLSYTVDRHTELRFTAFGTGESMSDAVTLHVSGPPDTVLVPEPTASSSDDGRWWWGPGLGGVLLVAGSSSFGVPFLSVAGGPSRHWYAKLQLGLRPSGAPGEDPVFPGEPRPEYQDRRVKLVSLNVLAFPTADWWGLSLAYSGAWETVSGLDYYVRRAHGPSGGVRARWPRNDEGSRGFHLLFGADVMYSNVSRYDETVSEWKFGVAPSLSLTFAFD